MGKNQNQKEYLTILGSVIHFKTNLWFNRFILRVVTVTMTFKFAKELNKSLHLLLQRFFKTFSKWMNEPYSSMIKCF